MNLELSVECCVCEEQFEPEAGFGYCALCDHESGNERVAMGEALRQAVSMLMPHIQTTAQKATVAPWLELLRKGGWS